MKIYIMNEREIVEYRGRIVLDRERILMINREEVVEIYKGERAKILVDMVKYVLKRMLNGGGDSFYLDIEEMLENIEEGECKKEKEDEGK